MECVNCKNIYRIGPGNFCCKNPQNAKALKGVTAWIDGKLNPLLLINHELVI